MGRTICFLFCKTFIKKNYYKSGIFLKNPPSATLWRKERIPSIAAPPLGTPGICMPPLCLLFIVEHIRASLYQSLIITSDFITLFYKYKMEISFPQIIVYNPCLCLCTVYDSIPTGEFTKRVREMLSQLFVCRGIDR